MKVVLTGAPGFIGRHAAHALIDRGHSVIGVARRPDRSIPIEWMVSDLLVPGEPRRIAREACADAVLHLAWTTEHGKYLTDPANSSWVESSTSLAKAAFEFGAKRFVGAGTCFEYDWPSTSDCDESGTPLANHLPYDTAKDAFRYALRYMAQAHDASFAWGRLFHLYGPAENPARLVPSIAKSLASGQPAECSSGKMLCDFMDARDAGAALATLAVSSVEGAINVASGEARTVASVAQLLGDVAGRPDLVKLGARPDRPNEPPRITASVERLRNEVGFRNAFSLRDGLEGALDYWTGRT